MFLVIMIYFYDFVSFIDHLYVVFLWPFHFLEKLNVNSETIQHGVEGLTYLLTESSKLMVSGYTMCSI